MFSPLLDLPLKGLEVDCHEFCEDDNVFRTSPGATDYSHAAVLAAAHAPALALRAHECPRAAPVRSECRSHPTGHRASLRVPCGPAPRLHGVCVSCQV